LKTIDFQNNIDSAFGLIQQNQLTEASAICKKLSEIVGPNALVSYLFAAIDLKNGELITATEYLKTAIRLDPTVTEYYLTLANALKSLGNSEEALEFYETALRLSPGQVNVLNNYGLALKASNRYTEAVEIFRNALKNDPNSVRARLNLAKLLRELGRKEDAIDCLNEIGCHAAATFAVTKASYHLPVIPASIQDMRHSRILYEREIIALADEECEIDEEHLLDAGTNFFSVYQGVDDKQFQEIISAYYRRNCLSLNYVAPNLRESPTGRIKIGFISTNFYNHTVGKLFRGLIASLNRQIFEVTVFSIRTPSDEISNFIKDHSDRNVTLVRNLNVARQKIGQQNLDILFYTDIGMDPFTYFLAFARLAPVQCVGWGHGVTTGIPTIDYFISDTHIEEADPRSAQSHYTEKLIRLSLPPSYLYKPVEGRPLSNLDLSFTKNQTVYFCGQSLHKIHPDFDQLLVEILLKDSKGVGILIEGMPGWSSIILNRLKRLDTSIAERIVFLPPLGQNEYFALLKRSDVVLDSIFFCGGISSIEALSFGKPVITWPNSPLLCSRVTTGYYHEMGVLDFIAKSSEEYIELANKLGTNLAWRTKMEAKIRNNSQLLFNRLEVVREFEDFFKSSVNSLAHNKNKS